mmetsp:Transcript_84614/g.236116  ORF Transcript_84614/g.236116 Transcript_84614/m.236116 type:complete len:81 (-) Transcript_84614:982-1224(-)
MIFPASINSLEIDMDPLFSAVEAFTKPSPTAMPPKESCFAEGSCVESPLDITLTGGKGVVTLTVSMGGVGGAVVKMEALP